PEAGRVQISFPRHAAALLDSLNRLRLEGKFCDVAVHVGGRVFPAHKSVLAAASPFFHDKLVLQDGGRLALPPAIDAGAFEGLLTLIYCGRLTVAVEALPGHLLVASGLQMWHVVDRCSQILREVEGGAGRWGARSAEGSSCVDHGEGLSSVWVVHDGDGAIPITEEVLQIRMAAGTSPVPPKTPDGEILKICVEEDEEDDDDDDEGPSGTGALRIVLEDAEDEAAAPRDPPKIFYVKQESGEADTAAIETLLPVMDLPPASADPMPPNASLFPQPAWKPVDLHGNEISGRGGGLHAPVKLGATPADGKRFGCACGKRFAVKPKRDRHIMLTLSLRPFACATCHKRFKLKHHLTEHMKTHDGARGACQGCGRRFRLRSGLAKHRPLCPGGRWGGGCWACE
ncbi:ZBTB9 protein, partial [Menura novaehollandiae]|nr:ZBTB9 protein [Menura novaehollandiae]